MTAFGRSSVGVGFGSLVVELAGLSHRFDDTCHIGRIDHVAAVHTLGKQFGYAVFDVLDNFLSLVVGKVLFQLVQIGIQRFVGVVVDIEHDAVQIDCQCLFHICCQLKDCYTFCFISMGRLDRLSF